MATFKYFITTSTKKLDKPATIRIRFYKGKQFDCKAPSKKSILPKYWNNKKGEVRDVADYLEKDEMASELKRLKNHIEREENNVGDKTTISTEWLNMEIDQFYYPEKYKPQQITFFSYIEKYIAESKDRINPNTGKKITRSTLLKYGTCFNYLKDFQKIYERSIDFDNIDNDFYNDFVKYLSKRTKETILKDGTIKTETGLATNTIGKQIAVLINFIHNAIVDKQTSLTATDISKFKIITEETDSIYLNQDELKLLYDLDLSNNKRLESVRDIFLIGAWTGLRFSDLHQVTLNNIVDNLIKIKQTKTGKDVVIPLHPIVKAILAKYNNKLPKILSNQKMNDYLKEIGELAELNDTFTKNSTVGGIKKSKVYLKKELLTTHTARRSFATNLYKDNFPTLSIMQITGHRTERSFLKYIKVTPEEHARKLEKHWEEKYSSHV
jgi:integrase